MMDSPWVSLVALVLFLLAIALGMIVRRRVQERHLSHETTAVVHATVAMLVTFGAIVLGLLMTSSKDNFSRAESVTRNYGTTLASLNNALKAVGPAGLPAEKALATYTAAIIASTWMDQPPPVGDYYPKNLGPSLDQSQENPALAELLEVVRDRINELPSATAPERQTQARCLALAARVMEQRVNMVAVSQVSLSKPFFFVLVFWLLTAFLCLGLSAPANILSVSVAVLAAVALTSALYVIVDLNTLYDNGVFSISSTPLRNALVHMPSS